MKLTTDFYFRSYDVTHTIKIAILSCNLISHILFLFKMLIIQMIDESFLVILKNSYWQGVLFPLFLIKQIYSKYKDMCVFKNRIDLSAAALTFPLSADDKTTAIIGIVREATRFLKSIFKSANVGICGLADRSGGDKLLISAY